MAVPELGAATVAANRERHETSVLLARDALIDQLKSKQKIDRERAKLQLRTLLRDPG